VFSTNPTQQIALVWWPTLHCYLKMHINYQGCFVLMGVVIGSTEKMEQQKESQEKLLRCRPPSCPCNNMGHLSAMSTIISKQRNCSYNM